jgi:hypothetical protein
MRVNVKETRLVSEDEDSGWQNKCKSHRVESILLTHNSNAIKIANQ